MRPEDGLRFETLAIRRHLLKKRGENEDMREKKRGKVAMDNLAYARDNAMMSGGMGGGMF